MQRPINTQFLPRRPLNRLTSRDGQRLGPFPGKEEAEMASAVDDAMQDFLEGLPTGGPGDTFT